MNQLLKIGSVVLTASGGHPCRIVAFLGGGGQGEVYRAELDGQELAVKWYFDHQATPAQRDVLRDLVHRGAPTDRFLWPMGLLEGTDRPGFGYLMPLREPRYKSIVDLMRKRVDPPFKSLATAGMELADSFLQLHTRGLSYRDISFGNVFFDPGLGSVLICDNDNVAVDGTDLATVLGTPGFMAPEIVTRQGKPCTRTDLYSLAVLLFYLLVVAHPLDGRRESSIRCLDLPAREKLYGSEALFIFDPHDDSNRPVPGLHDNAIQTWPLLPSGLQALFLRSFTAGLHDPEARVRESEWRRALADLRDAVFYCGACRAEQFHDGPRLEAAHGDPGVCWHCAAPLRLPPRLHLGRTVVMLNHDTVLHPHHVEPSQPCDLSRRVGEVVQHPQRPDVWGLQNLTDQPWDTTLPDGVTRAVAPGRSVTIAVGTRIRFGRVEGEIRA